MNSTYVNSRSPLASRWLSSVESYLQIENPGLSISEIRRLPMMQAVFAQVRAFNEKRRLLMPEDDAPRAEKMAFASQEYMALAMTASSVTVFDDKTYDDYLKLIDSYNADRDALKFSTSDLVGFALCVIVYVGYSGGPKMNALTAQCKHLLERIFPNYQDYLPKIQAFFEATKELDVKFQYRQAKVDGDNPLFPDTVKWRIPNNAQVIMLGDWGTGMDDAKAFLKALWEKAYLTNKISTIVFIHLGDIYYCGLDVECRRYFKDVFEAVGQELKMKWGEKFNPNPPIFSIPGNHEYYSYGIGYYNMIDGLNNKVQIWNQDVTNPQFELVDPADIQQKYSFFDLRSEDGNWQFLGMDTGQDDYNAVDSAMDAIMAEIPHWVKDAAHVITYIPLPQKLKWIGYSAAVLDFIFQQNYGPFMPKLQNKEATWLKAKLEEHQGNTILLSHHQLFSRQAQLDYKTPHCFNLHLEKTFKPYFTDKIAAWYWGHEHTFAVYMDGLMGLNKGRLLGSSSYEATEADDHPYKNNYPMIPFSQNKDIKPIKSRNGLFHHAAAIMKLDGPKIHVDYYQFPSWALPADAVQDAALSLIWNETIEKGKKVAPIRINWIGNKEINLKGLNNTDSPAIAEWDNYLIGAYLSKSTNNRFLGWVSADVSEFKPTSKTAQPEWHNKGNIMVEGSNGIAGPFSSEFSPALVTADAIFHLFFVHKDGKIGHLSYTRTTKKWSNHNIVLPSNDKVATDRAVAACYHQGKIQLVFCEKGTGYLHQVSYDREKETWTDSGVILDKMGQMPRTDQPPSIAAGPGQMVLVWKNYKTKTIVWAHYKPNETTGVGWRWTVKPFIQITAPDSKILSLETDLSPAITFSAGRMFMAYLGTDKQLRTCILDLESGTWLMDRLVKIGSETAKSNKAPAMVIANGGSFLLYKGKDHDNLLWAYC